MTSASIAARRPWVGYCLWLIFAATIVIYLWKPDWPNSVRRLPLWPWFALFVAVASFVTVRIGKRPSVRSIALGAGLLILCFYVEHLGATLVFEATQGRLIAGFLGPLDYLAVAFMNVMFNCSVVLTFVALQIMLLMAGTRGLSEQRKQL
jgi:hypothetical protein